MIWIYLVIVAQFLNAIVILVDKYFVTSKVISKPVIYTFYVGILSGFVLVLLPFGVIRIPTVDVIWLSFVIGFTYMFSLLFLYKSLKISDASDVAPVLGAIVSISTLVFSFLILKGGLSDNFLYGFIFLVVGTILMSYFRFSKKAFYYVFISGILFGLSSVFVKLIFDSTSFLDGFFWTRIANIIVALSLLIWPGNLKLILKHVKESSVDTKYLIVANKALAGFAFLFILIAINLGNVSIVNALAGIQFIFLILFAIFFTHKLPNFLYETVHRGHIVFKKVFATALIITGLVFLFL